MLSSKNHFSEIRKYIPDLYFSFSQIFSQAGFQAILVGGAVRDIVLETNPKDFDFATDAKPEQVQQLFHRVIPTGIQHGTVTVRYKGQNIEVTTLRCENSYTDHRHPDEVIFTNKLEEDIKRRDFTVNALAISLPDCKLLDYTNGLQDISAKCIRAIGKPIERFSEDALRIFRALRFSARLDFSISSETLQAMHEKAATIEKISKERIRDEWKKTLETNALSRALPLICSLGITDSVMPKPNPEKTKKTFSNDFSNRLASLLPPDLSKQGSNWLWRMTTLIFCASDASIDEIHSWLMDHRYTKSETNSIISKLQALQTPLPTSHAVSIRRFIKSIQPENWRELLAARDACCLSLPSKEILEGLSREAERGVISDISELAINGEFIMQSLSIAPGPHIGQLLRFLEQTVVETPESNTTQELLQLSIDFLTEKSIFRV